MKIFEALAGKSCKKASRRNAGQLDRKSGKALARSGNVTEKLLPDNQITDGSAQSNEGSAITVELEYSGLGDNQLPQESADMPDLQKKDKAWDCSFAVEYEITYIHTNEVIL